jgi:hypothetical protein
MGRISINNVQAGMVLAKDALNFRKQLLLPAGTVLTEKNIETMIAWGVSEVATEGCAEPSLEQVEQHIAEDPNLAEANAELDHRFADVRNDPLMKEILAIAKKQLLGGRA